MASEPGQEATKPAEPFRTATRAYWPILHLTLSRLRLFLREPSAVFWVYGFPILMLVSLGVAFRDDPREEIAVDLVEVSGSKFQVPSQEATESNPKSKIQSLKSALAPDPRFKVNVVSADEWPKRLQAGKTDLVIELAADGRLQFWDEPRRAESRLARYAVEAALLRGPLALRETFPSGPLAPREAVPSGPLAPRESVPSGPLAPRESVPSGPLAPREAVPSGPLAPREDMRLADRDAHTVRHLDQPGSRYIDFLLPGLIGMGLMGGGMWGVGFVIVDMRVRKLLKRFLATPMRRTDFLLAVMLSRLLFTLADIVVLLAFGYWVFGVRTQGSYLDLTAVVLLGGAAFAGIGLLVASRAQTLETVSGLMNLVILPMWVFSGVFFSSERFPAAAQPIINLLPLTALNQALRAIMLEGKPLSATGPQLAILGLYAAITFAIALKTFRWR